MRKKTRILCFFIATVFSAAAVFALIQWYKAAIPKIAFYDLPENTVNAISLQIEFINPKAKIQIYSKPQTQQEYQKIQKQLKRSSIIFSLSPPQFFTQEFPDDLYKMMPPSFYESYERTQLPVLLDHFELSYFKPLQKHLDTPYPTSYKQLIDYLSDSKKYTEHPLFCQGGDDKNLFWMISSVSNSLYEKRDLIAKYRRIRNSKNAGIQQTIIKEMTPTLNAIKDLQKGGLLDERWFLTTTADFENVLTQDKAGVIALSLSDHRKIPYNLIKNYSAHPMPVLSSPNYHGILTPAVSAWLVTNSRSSLFILQELLSSHRQGLMSSQTGLAPAALRAEAGDKQSDDVRYQAAACLGPVTSVDLFAGLDFFELKTAAEAIRNYLAQP